jgi:hypothetical protein
MLRAFPSNANLLMSDGSYRQTQYIHRGARLTSKGGHVIRVNNVHKGPQLPALNLTSKYWYKHHTLLAHQELLSKDDHYTLVQYVSPFHLLKTPSDLSFLSAERMPKINLTPSYDSGYVLGAFMAVGFIMDHCILFSCTSHDFMNTFASRFHIAFPQVPITLDWNRIKIDSSLESIFRLVESSLINLMIQWQHDTPFLQGIHDGFVEAFRYNNSASITPYSYHVISCADMLIKSNYTTNEIMSIDKSVVLTVPTTIIDIEKDMVDEPVVMENLFARGLLIAL